MTTHFPAWSGSVISTIKSEINIYKLIFLHVSYRTVAFGVAIILDSPIGSGRLVKSAGLRCDATLVYADCV